MLADMLFDLPDSTDLYAALIARDPSWDGRAFVGVRTTGVFCRLTCPARKPKPGNCQFYPSVSACLEAGFRPCKRCHPIKTAADADPAIQDLLARIEANPGHRWRESGVAALGYDPSTIRRAFKRNFGCTFLDMARHRRLQSGFSTLATGGPVIDAQLDAGYDSPSAFRAAFAKLLGHPPTAFSGPAMLQADWFQTPIGPMIAVSDQSHLHLLEFSDRKALPNQLKRLYQATKGQIGFGCPPPTTHNPQPSPNPSLVIFSKANLPALPYRLPCTAQRSPNPSGMSYKPYPQDKPAVTVRWPTPSGGPAQCAPWHVPMGPIRSRL